jgi:hypothetical protein
MAVELAKLLKLGVEKKASELNVEVDVPPSLLLKGDPRPLKSPLPDNGGRSSVDEGHSA